MKKRAIISVSNKSNIVNFAIQLEKMGYEIISTGNTHNLLKVNNVNSICIEDVTKFPEILDGRVKTLNPYIHAGILFKRDSKTHLDTINQYKVNPIDIVVVNLYDFEGAIAKNKSHEDIIENIDIGGPTLIRAAAKNYKDVLVVTDIDDYEDVLNKLKKNEIDQIYKKELAFKAYSLTARYDSIISNYFANHLNEKYPKYINIALEKESTLRYGENPHQRASLYKNVMSKDSYLRFEQLNGKEISFNNMNDLNGAISLSNEFDNQVCAVAVKHTNPCGVAISDNSFNALKKCYESDKVSIFGGIIVVNSIIDEDCAKLLSDIFVEIVAAYDFTDKALEILKIKKNLRILKLERKVKSLNKYDMKYIDGKMLIQDSDDAVYDKFEIVTNNAPNENMIEDMKFAMKIVKHMKSNAIAIVKNGQTLALGPGQTSRIFSLENAIDNNKDKNFQGAILASDAFFPFDDCVKLAGKIGIEGIIQPGGSIKDIDSINKCNEMKISMVFTGMRHFKH